jgi:hypothetical protein
MRLGLPASFGPAFGVDGNQFHWAVVERFHPDLSDLCEEAPPVAIDALWNLFRNRFPDFRVEYLIVMPQKSRPVVDSILPANPKRVKDHARDSNAIISLNRCF